MARCAKLFAAGMGTAAAGEMGTKTGFFVPESAFSLPSGTKTGFFVPVPYTASRISAVVHCPGAVASPSLTQA